MLRLKKLWRVRRASTTRSTRHGLGKGVAWAAAGAAKVVATLVAEQLLKFEAATLVAATERWAGSLSLFPSQFPSSFEYPCTFILALASFFHQFFTYFHY